jgi:AcrR family transcriptional regulator
MTSTDVSPVRDTYRHGDLRRALLAVGIELARTGGPDAVVLREAARRVGVSPAAAYRHFADHHALLHAVCASALSALAVAIEEALDECPTDPEPVAAAHARLRAVGTGYLRFARAEPGLFRTAFAVPEAMRGPDSGPGTGSSGLTPFQLLAGTLDGLVAAGALPRERRPDAEYLAWSAVHGLAMLTSGGPLRGLDGEQLAALGQRLLDMVERGL